MLKKIVLCCALILGTSSTVNADSARCYLEYQQNVYIDGTCTFTNSGSGGFNLSSSDGWEVSFEIVDEGWGTAFWNADGHDNYGDRLVAVARLHANLGYLRREEEDGACWSNYEARLCAW